VTAAEVLALAKARGVTILPDGDDLDLASDCEPDPDLLNAIASCKAEILAKLREERRRIVQWINANFSSSSPDVCRHCRRGPRLGDAFSIAVTIPASFTNRAGRRGRRLARPKPGAHWGSPDDWRGSPGARRVARRSRDVYPRRPALRSGPRAAGPSDRRRSGAYGDQTRGQPLALPSRLQFRGRKGRGDGRHEARPKMTRPIVHENAHDWKTHGIRNLPRPFEPLPTRRRTRRRGDQGSYRIGVRAFQDAGSGTTYGSLPFIKARDLPRDRHVRQQRQASSALSATIHTPSAASTRRANFARTAELS
jgi:hypothetical protein